MFDRWLNRRRAIKDLRSRDDELRQEYMKMREQDRIRMAQAPPGYGEVRQSSGESVVGMGTDNDRRNSGGLSSSAGSTRS